jgi:hypothetical protein
MNPYEKLPDKAFWKLAVADRSMFDIAQLWSPKFHIKTQHRVATFGSCFAQHIGNALHKRGFNWFIAEQPPKNCDDALAKKYGYKVFSARTGNIYTTSLLKQWTQWALGEKAVPNEVWTKDGRYFDPFRPRIETNGFESSEEMKLSQAHTLTCFKDSIVDSDYFVFTLGLTESWSNVEGYEYPMCPGTVAGEFDETLHKFENQQFDSIRNNLTESMRLIQSVNPEIKFILTVSPVPLTATMSGKHVAVATMASKSILRAVAEQLSANSANVDYFPSYEIINSPIFRGAFFEPNQRSVNPHGVNFVMDTFFKCLVEKYGENMSDRQPVAIESKGSEAGNRDLGNSDAQCEEELLAAFGGKK